MWGTVIRHAGTASFHTRSNPTRCPNALSVCPLLSAYRLLPSMMKATCAGRGPCLKITAARDLPLRASHAHQPAGCSDILSETAVIKAQHLSYGTGLHSAGETKLGLRAKLTAKFHELNLLLVSKFCKI